MEEFAQLLMGYFKSTDSMLLDASQQRLVGASLVGAVTHTGMVWVRSGYEWPLETVVDAAQKVFWGTSSQFINRR
jgi:hypothetical protein